MNRVHRPRPRSRRFRTSRAFSLVEVSLALSIIALAMVTLFALLPMALRSNQISTQESRAAFLLTMIEMDMRNSTTLGNQSESPLYGISSLHLPYSSKVSLRQVDINPALDTSSTYTYFLNENEECGQSLTDVPRPTYRLTIRYTNVPPPSSLTPALARLTLTWPANVDPDENPQRVQGRVDTVVSFPVP